MDVSIFGPNYASSGPSYFMSKSSLLSTNSVVNNDVSLCDNQSNSSDSFCLSDASSSKTNLSFKTLMLVIT